MDSIERLPNSRLQPHGVVSEQFLQRGLETFHAACCWVKALPYGSNSCNEDSMILFAEGRGTCTTKHGAIARLAAEQSLPVFKTLGFYRLNDEIVTGVSALLASHDLAFIPQIHCFLAYEGCRVDLTEGNCNGKNKTIEDYDFTVQVKPDLTKAEEEAYYLDYLRRYHEINPHLAALEPSKILALLDACNQQVKYQCSVMANRLVEA